MSIISLNAPNISSLFLLNIISLFLIVVINSGLNGFSHLQSLINSKISLGVTNENLIFVGGVNTWQSNDGGVNWNISSHWYGGGGVEYKHADEHYLRYNEDNGILYSANDGGLYYSNNDMALIWGSELKSLKSQLNYMPKICEKALALYFSLTYIPAPYTIYEGILKLEPYKYIEYSIIERNRIEYRNCRKIVKI